MNPTEKSGFFYPNKLGFVLLNVLEEEIGRNRLNAIFNLTSLEGSIGNYPEDNMDKGFDFADISAISQALEDMYGPRGGRGVSLRAGRAIYAYGLSNFGALAGITDQSFQALPLPVKLRIGAQAMAKVLSLFSDQVTSIEECEDTLVFRIHRCPVCWGRSGQDHPVCFLATGLIKESLKWISGGKEFRVNESQCIAMGDKTCGFIIQKNPLN